MDVQLHQLYNVTWSYLTIPNFNDETVWWWWNYFIPTFYWGRDYLSMLWSKLIHVGKGHPVKSYRSVWWNAAMGLLLEPVLGLLLTELIIGTVPSWSDNGLSDPRGQVKAWSEVTWRHWSGRKGVVIRPELRWLRKGQFPSWTPVILSSVYLREWKEQHSCCFHLSYQWLKHIFITHLFVPVSGVIPGVRPANERRRYFVTTSLIGWVQA